MNPQDSRRLFLCLHHPTARRQRRQISFTNLFSSHCSLHVDEGHKNFTRKIEKRTVRNRTLGIVATQAAREPASLARRLRDAAAMDMLRRQRGTRDEQYEGSDF